MAGVRIRLTEERRPEARVPAVIAIRDLSHRGSPDPDGNWPGCAACSLPPPGHAGYKTKHVKIDADGYAIVAAEYWADLQRFVDNGGFELANPVPSPPRQELILGGRNAGLVVHHKMMRPILSEQVRKTFATKE